MPINGWSVDPWPPVLSRIIKLESDETRVEIYNERGAHVVKDTPSMRQPPLEKTDNSFVCYKSIVVNLFLSAISSDLNTKL